MTAGAGGAAAEGRSGAFLQYTLFGVRLASEHELANRVQRIEPARDDGPEARPELTFRYVTEAPLTPGWDRAAPSYASPIKIDEHQSFLYVIEADGCIVYRFSEVVDFFIWPDRILGQVHDPAYAYMVELHLLGFVMSAWLEERGIVALHAAAVVVDDHAVGFVSTNQGGKSSLAASFMQAGHALLTDDILPIERAGDGFAGRPAYPQMRMWPDQAQHFLGSDGDLDLVHPKLEKRRIPVGPGAFGTFCDEARPLACLYLPERREGGDVAFTDLTFAESVFALTRYSFLAEILEDAGQGRRRFGALARIARAVPLRRVAYPSGVDRLPEVTAAIAADAAGLGRRG